MRLLFLWLALASASVVTATALPPTYTLTGRIVIADTGTPLEYATVTAATPDSTLVDGTITDTLGRFSLSVPAGTYRLSIEFIGYARRDTILQISRDEQLGIIALAPDGIGLETVEVTATKSQLQLQLDKKIFQVGSDLLAQGGSAVDVLANVPSLSVDAEGNVSLRGDDGVTILIDGKPSALANNSALSSIPAGHIERVEVITTPSARYQASGTAGIINIILKKDRRRGFNGSASLSAGRPADTEATFEFNLRREKLNFFGNIGARYSNFLLQTSTDRKNFLAETPPFLQQTDGQERNDQSAFGFIGLDYLFDERNTLTTSYSNYTIRNDDRTRTDVLFFDSRQELEQQWQQILDYDEPESYHQLDLQYTHSGEQKDRELRVMLQHDFWYNDETEQMRITDLFPREGERLNLRTNTVESSHDYLAQIDYSQALFSGRWEAGLRGETRIISSDYLAEFREGGLWTVYQGLDNRLDYYERIGAAYTQYAGGSDRLNYQLGLRAEYSNVGADEVGPVALFRKDYLRFFPSLSLSYKWSEAIAWQLSYGRRIRRPSFWQLNPFRGLSDPNEIFIGNPDLDPAYTNRLETNALWKTDLLTVNPALYYATTTDYFDIYYTQREDGVVIQRPVNLEREQRYGFEVNATYRPLSAVDIYGEFHVYGFQQRGQFAERNFRFGSSTWNSRLRVTYRLPAAFTFQGSVDYVAPVQDAQARIAAIRYADFSLGKQLLNDRFSITLNVRNAFNSKLYRLRVDLPDFEQDVNIRWQVRRIELIARYSFDQGEAGPRRRARGSIR